MGESDDGAAARAQQIWEGEQFVELGRYQRLNRLGSSNRDSVSEADYSMDDNRERENTLMPGEMR